jgi:hypothetical protein
LTLYSVPKFGPGSRDGAKRLTASSDYKMILDMVTRRSTLSMRFRKTGEERREEEAAREARRHAANEARKAWEFRRSPAGQARESFEGGAQVFHITLPLGKQGDKDASNILNLIIAEGWRIHSFSTASSVSSSSSRDGVLTVTSVLHGTYLFVRDSAVSGRSDSPVLPHAD